MTNKQLFNAMGGVEEKYLSEMLECEPQRAIELRPVKRSPIKKIAAVTAACLALAGAAAGGAVISGKVNLSALFGNFRANGSIVPCNGSISENCSAGLENFVIEDDWLKDRPSEYAEVLRGSADYNCNTVTADLKLSFSAWDKLPNETVVARVRFFTDGDPLEYLPIQKNIYSYYPDPKPSYLHDEIFDREKLNYGELGHFPLNKSKADNADSDSEEKTFEFPVTFDVKKNTRQVTLVVEFVAFDPSDYFFDNADVVTNNNAEIITRTYPIGVMSDGDNQNKLTYDRAYMFKTNGFGWFSTERQSPEYAQAPTTVFSENGTLTINTSNISFNTPYYLTAMMDGEPLKCFDGECSLLVDPVNSENKFTYTVPKECVAEEYGTRELWLLAIPVVEGELYADGGVFAAPISQRYFFEKKYTFESE